MPGRLCPSRCDRMFPAQSRAGDQSSTRSCIPLTLNPTQRKQITSHLTNAFLRVAVSTSAKGWTARFATPAVVAPGQVHWGVGLLCVVSSCLCLVCFSVSCRNAPLTRPSSLAALLCGAAPGRLCCAVVPQLPGYHHPALHCRACAFRQLNERDLIRCDAGVH